MNNGFKKGYIPTETHLKRLSVSHLGQTPWNKGLKTDPEVIEKIRKSRTGKRLNRSEEGKKSFKEKMSGPNNPRWTTDRSKIDMGKRSNWTIQCIEWRESVFKRDNYKCKMSNGDCNAYVEAHHILNWKDYPELRFNINNGITLCRAHHPRKRAEEKRLVPTFKELVSVSIEPLR